MSRAHKITNIVVVILPFVAFVTAVILLWNRLVGWTDLAIFLVMYLPTGFGITVGFHRLFTHRSFETYKPIRYTLAVLGSMAVEGPVIRWVSDHRKHHTFSDEEGDPHSPHVEREPGIRGALKGLWYAHVGWLFETVGEAEPRRYARDLVEDPIMRKISRRFPWLVGLSLALPFALGLAITGSLAGGLTAFLWGGLVRMFFVHHVTWSINSVCHFFGWRRFDTPDHSRNVPWLALLSFGESWHHNHHAFPRSASHGLRWWEIDTSGLLIRAMERLGLAWNVVRVSPERQQEKVLTPA